MRSFEQGSLPELLAPAGSFDALCAAVEAGVDAVYFGSSDFNARMRAKNFSGEELSDAVRLCREYGVKAYVTLNTRLKDRELERAASLALDLYEAGADAFIVADLSLARLLKACAPDIELHASTQLSCHSSLDAEALYKEGFSRMVCPRELSFEEITELVKRSPVEIEMFIHGAHCVSFSGQCMMSFAMGGRSGNRGSCAQPCRLPFSPGSVKNAHPLSLRDMCLAGSIRDVIRTGAASLKIEGRQKSPGYVYGVCRMYRRLLDERRNASAEEIEQAAELFCRGGFTDGYFTGRYGSMLGVRSFKDFENSRAADSFEGLKRKLPLSASLTLKIGERARLEVDDGKRHGEALGEPVGQDAERAVSPDAAREKTGRLGGTAFVLDSFDFNAEEGAFYTLSGINRLRREAIGALIGDGKRREIRRERLFVPGPASSGAKDGGSYFPDAPAQPEKILRTAEFTSFSQIGESSFDYFDKIYIPLSDISHADGDRICLALPPLLFDCEIEETAKILSGAGGEVLVHSLGQASLVRGLGLEPVGSFRFNVFSAESARAVSELAKAPALSPEMTLGAARDVRVPFSLIVYGKIPLMHTMRCILSDGGAVCPFSGGGGRTCPAREKHAAPFAAGISCDRESGLCRGTLCDRRGAKFPVVGLPDCTNIIYNCVPIYMADRQEALSLPFAARHHFIFSDESAEACGKITDAYKKGLSPDKNHAVRRLK